MSGHSVSAAHDQIIGPLAGRGSANSNGYRQRGSAVIAENASDAIGLPRSPGMDPGGPAGNDGDAEKLAHTRDVSTPSVAAGTAGFK